MENVKSAFSKKARRRKQKQCLEKRRRGNIKKSIEELASLIPEIREQIAHGQRLQQSKILQLVVDYVRSSQQESNGLSQRRDDRVLDHINSNEYGCPCTYYKQQFHECVEDTGTCSPNYGHNLQSPLDGQHAGRHLCSSREEPRHSPYSFSSREESLFEKGDASMSFCHRHWCSNSNVASIEVTREGVAMDTMVGTPPLRALKSMCSSVSPVIFPAAVSASRDAFSREYPRTRNSDQSVLDSVLQKPRSYRLIPQTTPPFFCDLSPRLESESHELWRPWIA